MTSLFFPADCKICGNPLEPLNRSFICGDCWNKVKWLKEPYCFKCSKPFPSLRTFQGVSSPLCQECQKNPPCFNRLFAPTLYEGVMRKAIHLLKYNAKKGVLRGIEKVIKIYFNSLTFLSSDLIIPIPLHKKRLKQRGFNQSELLALIIAKYLHIKLVNNNLERIKPTPSQIALNRKERIKNMKGAFRLKNEEELRGKNILLVDDVYTTGTTVKEASKTIIKARPKEIYVFVLARAI